ncbi:ATP-binding cassette domain-containing protein [Candidatus Pandoraea novymonadis]|uniref:ABC transporter ATP-binding protein YheS n=1 Tax=Candidatus Pandoraea novymonadis TaxID=1808959 RepID=A0ABX5FFW6_9BURK|nr:ATP-binding cassette domain-containing protein [Candidatus Pandoraea novymonadis]PSB92047.1 putative ABC transporter ATP-binding protein YheS [Candidatus Pandoraea novymonadis]
MIRFENLTIVRGTKLLFKDTSIVINPGESVGLVGANGAGKSSLLGLMHSQMHPDSGDVFFPNNWRIAYVRQETPTFERTALEYVLDGDSNLRKTQAQIADAQARGDGYQEANAHIAFADANGYSAPARGQSLLLGLGFTLAQSELPVSSFSGGWRMRLNLAQALMCPSELLLLDEPTNHLDLDAIIWLEDWLSRYTGTLFIVSHDREFLDSVCNVILHIENHKLKRYGGNYSQFEILREHELALEQSTFEKQQATIAHLESFITRFKAKATKATQAKSRVRALRKMERISPRDLNSLLVFNFHSVNSAPNPMLVLNSVCCGYKLDSGREQVILPRVTLSVQKDKRIALLGANGQGKSTLIKTLAGYLPPLAGNITQGKGLKIGYFSQHQIETLENDNSPLQHLQRLAPDAHEQELRDFLGGFNFRSTMAMEIIKSFSGGEKARLALALIIWQKPNLLLLDEPTNHLDLETRQALIMAISQFNGTLIIVSHDRDLLRGTTDEFLLIADSRVQPFNGDLDDYRNWLLKNLADQRTAGHKKERDTQGSITSNINRQTKKRIDAKERHRLTQLRKPLQIKIESLEKAMVLLNKEKIKLDALLADKTLYEPSKKIALMDSLKRHSEVKFQLAETESSWLTVQEAFEKIDC